MVAITDIVMEHTRRTVLDAWAHYKRLVVVGTTSIYDLAHGIVGIR